MIILVFVRCVLQEAIDWNFHHISDLLLHLDALSHELRMIDFFTAFHLVLEIIVGRDSQEFVSLLRLVL
jgi:hypothetical protein